MHAGQRKLPHLTAKQPPLQQNVVDLSHHRRSPLLSMQVIVSSSTLDASPNLFHHLFSGKPGILDILQRLKDKGPLSTNKAEPCTLPEWELKMFLCSCSLEEWKWCAGQAFQLQLLMTGSHRHCSILSRSTKKWPYCLILSIFCCLTSEDFNIFIKPIYVIHQWHERHHVWCHFHSSATGTCGMEGFQAMIPSLE